MESTTSDYDVRFIYVRLPVLETYLSLFDAERNDTIEGYKNKSAVEHDFSGWDLRKFLLSLGRSNVDALEWLISHIVYHNPQFHGTDYIDQISRLACENYNKRELAFSYLGLAKRKLNEKHQTIEQQVKKLLYVVRGLLAASWIINNEHAKTLPPINFEELLKSTDSSVCDSTVMDAISNLLQMKRGTEKCDEQVAQKVEQWITSITKSLQEKAKTLPATKSYVGGDRKKDEDDTFRPQMDQLFFNILQHVQNKSEDKGIILFK
jgi:predicted nucleotidyltransferase